MKPGRVLLAEAVIVANYRSLCLQSAVRCTVVILCSGDPSHWGHALAPSHGASPCAEE
jgi:hypothetical protein